MKNQTLAALMMALPALCLSACNDNTGKGNQQAATRSHAEHALRTAGQYFKPEQVTTQGSVTVEGNRIDYTAVAGTLVVHPKGWDDVPGASQSEQSSPPPGGGEDAAKPQGNPTAEASMFYVAYFKKGEPASNRPITFLYNGGPGSATIWLHMGAFGPRRIKTSDDTHTPPAPYDLVNNDYSLLDASDLVFIDAPGTGFSRIAGKDKDKAFYGVDQDAHAFAEFITEFLSKYNRWNSPKFLFGESYGTTRSALLANLLTTEYDTDLNGVILLSQILNFDLSVDGAQRNPGVDLPYALALPTYAATAWYHHKAAGAPGDLEAFLKQVEQFAMNEYLPALEAGASLDPGRRQQVIAKLAQYTGLSPDYLNKADMRVNGGEFEKNLLGDSDETTGRLDTRFAGPTLDPLSEGAEYDPQAAAISSAYVSAFNTYVRQSLKFGQDKTYKPSNNVFRSWDRKHQQPHSQFSIEQTPNVMPDLANAMKYDPNLKVLLNAGYYDLATPFFEGIYEMQHLPMPQKLQANISFKFYQSGHMVYAHEPALKALHDNTAEFIRANSGGSSTASSGTGSAPAAPGQ